MPHRSLPNILGHLRQRVLAIDGAAGILWGLVAAAASLAVGIWFDLMLELPPELRIALLVCAALVATGLFLRLLRRGFSQAAPNSLARRLDAALGTGGQILSGVDFLNHQTPAAYSQNPDLTRGLAALAVQDATRLADKAVPGAIYPARAVRRSAGSLACVSLLAVAATLLLPGLAATEWQRFVDPFGDHPPFTSVVFDVEPGDCRVVYGSGLDIHVTSGGVPVEGVELVWHSQPAAAASPGSDTEISAQPISPGDETLPMFPESGSRWRATVASVVDPAEYFVRARNGRSRRFRIEVITVPRIEAVTFRVTPPPYTRLPATEGPLPSGGLSGLAGSLVQFVVRSNRPLSTGTVTYIVNEDRRESPLQPAWSGGETVSGSFEIAGTGKIEIEISDVAGQRSTEKFSAAVTQLADEHPFVRLLEPKAVSYATPSAVIPVAISAEDDYGVSRVQLFRSLNDSRYLPMDIPLASPPPRQAYHVVPLPLAAYGLEAGDEVKLFARVEDNDPQARAIAGAETSASPNPEANVGKGAESSVVLIRIISHEEFERMLSAREGLEATLSKYQEIRRRMETLAEEMETLQKQLKEQPPGEERNEATRRELERLAGQMQEAIAAIERLQNERAKFPLDKELKKELARLAKALKKQDQQARALAENKAPNKEVAEALQEMLDKLRGEREELDRKVTQPLEMLAKVLPLKRAEARFVQLYRMQRDLADRLASLKNSEREDNPALKARMRDLESEQRQLREELERLLDDIEDHATRISGDEELRELHDSALEFVKALRESGAKDAMAGAESGLAEFSGSKGHAQALAAADILEKFIGKCKSMGGQAGQAGSARFGPSISEAMQQTLEQMLQNEGLGEQGLGAGGEGGYSSRRNSLDNVGLYGEFPSSDSQPNAGEGKSSRQASGTGGRGSGQGASRSADAESHAAEGQFKATSGSEEAIPLRYRRQVGRYFQRIADELGGP